MKYKLEMYGWSVEAMGHSLNDSQVKSIQDLMESNGHSELWEVRNDLDLSLTCNNVKSPLYNAEVVSGGSIEEFSYERLEKSFQSKYHLLNTEVS